MKVLTEESELSTQLANAGTKLVVVEFFAETCEPCRIIAPKFEEMSLQFSNVVFLKVDVEALPGLAEANKVFSMPTFQFFRNKVKIDELKGCNPKPLREKIMKYSSGEDSIETDPNVKGYMDLYSLINETCSECLNESDTNPFHNCLLKNGSYLESDCDEQLILFVSFNQPVRLHSFKLMGPLENGPKTIKLFINQPRTLDFDQAEGMEPVQSLSIEASDLENCTTIPLRYVKFQNVQNITIFMKDNQQGMDTTQLDYLCFIGTPVSSTDMSDFKRVAGKKGESH
ncbi:thioredoxin-like protein 1 [Octopus bimaculoides]|uniref:PITH domain-containing protein n=1 Tax=Octopus bimaculoides TaxID=37653 RepID=A0A0L8GSV7_OCTBM|nr:thioredoxin-like protein 1 [Octopus bimaculoides]|eukprot:XP_014778589.1 PREDICTED: thioredoxin-like protein 1 [Octopus bimaculoides]